MTMPSLTERAHDGAVGDPPMPDRPRRRRFTAEYKLAILADYDRLSADGAKGALLRREGVYTSHLVEWRPRRTVAASWGTSASPKPAGEAAALAKATRRAERTEAELAKTRVALEIMGKAHALFEMLADSVDSEPEPKS